MKKTNPTVPVIVEPSTRETITVICRSKKGKAPSFTVESDDPFEVRDALKAGLNLLSAQSSTPPTP